MDISLECSVSLSKRLRSIIGNSEAKVTLITDMIKDGKGIATLLISGDEININAATQGIGNETSIQFTPIAVKDQIPSTSTVANLFSTSNHTSGPRTAVDKMAVTVPPERHAVAHAIKKLEEITVPEAFPEYQEPEFKSFVSNYEELTMAIKAAQGKQSEIDPNTIEDPRRRAVAFEMKEKAEAIDMPAHVVNTKCGSLRINDIDLSLVLNAPFNLANISAKRLSSSGDLKAMIRDGYVKFIAPTEVETYRHKAIGDVEIAGYETFSHHSDAINSIESSDRMPVGQQIEIPTGDETPSEQEQLAGLINLTPMSGEGSGGARTSFHGSSAQRYKQTVAETSQENKQGIKTIRKLKE